MKKDLIIIGSGGHARSIIDVAIAQDKYNIIGCVSNEKVGKEVAYSIKVIGDDSILEDIFSSDVKNCFVAIGNNLIRKKIYSKLIDIGFSIVNIISPNSIISPASKIGSGVCVLHNSFIGVNVEIGDNTIINSSVSIDHDCKIGNHCHIAPGVAMSGTVLVEDGTHIGTGSSIIDGVSIGKWSYAGAGSVIVKDVESNILVYGVPARFIKKIGEGFSDE